MKRMLLTLGAILSMGGPALPAGGEDVNAAIDAVTRPGKTPGQKAQLLVDAAKDLADKKLAVAFLARAVDLAKRAARGGEPAAGFTAVRLLERKAPEKAAQWREDRRELVRTWFRYASAKEKSAARIRLFEVLLGDADEAERAANWPGSVQLLGEAGSLAGAIPSPRKQEIVLRGKSADHWDGLTRQVQALQKSVAGSPGNIGNRRRLVALLVIEMDDATSAAKWTTADMKETWRTLPPLAAKGPAGLAEQAAKELAQWYHRVLTDKASRFANRRRHNEGRDVRGDVQPGAGQRASARVVHERRQEGAAAGLTTDGVVTQLACRDRSV
jgi:hypothetical protein